MHLIIIHARLFEDYVVPGVGVDGESVGISTDVKPCADFSVVSDPTIIGHVAALSGDVTAHRGGQTHVLAKGDPVSSNMVIKTGDNSAVGISGNDGFRASLGPNGELDLATFSQAPAEIKGKDGFDLKIEPGDPAILADGEYAKTQSLAQTVLEPALFLGVKG